METNTAKHFALQLGALVALYTSLTSLLTLLFGVINLSFPDALDSFWQYESAQQSVRFSIAVLIVAFPTYLVLTRLVNTIRRTEQGAYLVLMKWLIYLSLLLGGGVLLGDLVFVINTYLNGELTQRFILKALAVFIVVGAAFYYYLLDARSYWKQHERRSLMYGGIAVLVVVISLALGFTHIETPEVVREIRLDEQQITDLQDMQFRIEAYYRMNGMLPDEAADLYVGVPVPTAPDSRPSYAYTVTGERTYELCATFTHPTQQDTIESPMLRPDRIGDSGFQSWEHEAERFCFERTVAGIETREEESQN